MRSLYEMSLTDTVATNILDAMISLAKEYKTEFRKGEYDQEQMKKKLHSLSNLCETLTCMIEV